MVNNSEMINCLVVPVISWIPWHLCNMKLLHYTVFFIILSHYFQIPVDIYTLIACERSVSVRNKHGNGQDFHQVRMCNELGPHRLLRSNEQ